MSLSEKEIQDFLLGLGFNQENERFWIKKYNNAYQIVIDFDRKKILYKDEYLEEQDQIQLGDETTSNFANSENFVVLECVNRLLEKGYPPRSLSLEHKWGLGREHKGKLDILVHDQQGNPYLMIECKTAGSEFSKEYQRMKKDGGQLFTYFKQSNKAQWLCLYSSRLGGGGGGLPFKIE